MSGRPGGDPDYAERVRESFARQSAMALIGARLGEIAPGRVDVVLPFRDDLLQQHGFIHGGIVGMISDSACGYAAFTLFPAGSSILTVEYKLNLLAPAKGDVLIARGRVKRPGRTLTVCEGEVVATSSGGGAETLVATALTTMMTLAGRSDLPAG